MSEAEFRYDPEKHEYWLGDERLPSVTEVLLKAGLVDDTWWTEFGRVRGSAVHKACELWDLGTLDPKTVDDRIQPYLDAWKRFTEEMEPAWDFGEEPVHDPLWKYAGTLDRLGHVRNQPRATLVDIKTGDPGKATVVQMAAYANAATTRLPSAGLTPDLMAVRLQPDGQFRLSIYPFTSVKTHFAVFTAALTLLRWKGEI